MSKEGQPKRIKKITDSVRRFGLTTWDTVVDTGIALKPSRVMKAEKPYHIMAENLRAAGLTEAAQKLNRQGRATGLLVRAENLIQGAPLRPEGSEFSIAFTAAQRIVDEVNGNTRVEDHTSNIGGGAILYNRHIYEGGKKVVEIRGAVTESDIIYSMLGVRRPADPRKEKRGHQDVMVFAADTNFMGRTGEVRTVVYDSSVMVFFRSDQPVATEKRSSKLGASLRNKIGRGKRSN